MAFEDDVRKRAQRAGGSVRGAARQVGGLVKRGYKLQAAPFQYANKAANAAGQGFREGLFGQPDKQQLRQGVANAAAQPGPVPQAVPQRQNLRKLNDRTSVDNNGKMVIPERRAQPADQQTSVIRGEQAPQEFKFKNPQDRAYQLEQGISDDQLQGYLGQKDASGKPMWDARSARADIAQRLTEQEKGYGLKDGGYGGFASYIGEDGKQRQLHTNPNAPNALFDSKEEAKRGQTFDVTGKEKAIAKADADIFATREGIALGRDKLNLMGGELDLKREALQNDALAPQKSAGSDWQKIKDANGDEQLVLANPDGSYTNARPRGFDQDASDFQRYIQDNPKNKQAALQRLRAKHGSIVDRYFGDILED